ncbi:MAG: winged helix-turn-helix transcriptional regulator [Candidatus Woesearchaeota archaeon]
MEYCIYYDKRNEAIIDFLPADIDSKVKQKITEVWNQEITREILKIISEEDEITAPKIKEKIGHSASTLHENIKKLEDLKLIESKMIFKGNKKKIIKPKILCVTKNPNYKEKFQKFFQGLFVDTKNTKKIIECLERNKNKFLSIEEISIKTKIPVDEIEILLKNWDSQITRSLSDFMKEKPFEKKTLYKYKNTSLIKNK